MAKLRNTFLAVLFVAGLAQAADPSLLQLVTPGAKAIAGLQVEQSKQSPLGKYFLGHMSSNDIQGDKFLATAGFDPKRDVSELVFVSNGSLGDGTGPGGAILARGTFNPTRIESAVQAKGGTLTAYQGFDMLSGNQTGENWALTFLDTTTAVLGDIDSVKAVIRQKTSAAPAGADWLDKVRQLSSNNDFWFLTLAPLSDLAGAIPNGKLGGAMGNGQMFQSITQASGGLRFGDSVVFTADAVTRSDKDAQALADVVRFLASMIQTNRQQNAATQRVASLLDSMTLQTNGNAVHLSLSVPEADMENLLEGPPQQAAKRMHLAPKPPVQKN